MEQRELLFLLMVERIRILVRSGTEPRTKSDNYKWRKAVRGAFSGSDCCSTKKAALLDRFFRKWRRFRALMSSFYL